MSKKTFFQLSLNIKQSSIHPDPAVDIKTVSRSRSDSLDKQTIDNTTILNFDGAMYNSKIVDVNENNIIQIIFKYNNQYNRWKCKLNLKKNTYYDNRLTNIYLKSFINTIQIVKCFIFDKDNYLLIDIIDKERLTSAVTFIQDKTNELQIVNGKNTSYIQKMCEITANCMSEAITSDIIDYDEYIKIIYNTKKIS